MLSGGCRIIFRVAKKALELRAPSGHEVKKPRTVDLVRLEAASQSRCIDSSEGECRRQCVSCEVPDGA